ncbi:MBOAT family O-acyltransferase [Cypionkella psychrotolerans]|uniref:MBOAT family O-acyltransferase n=1 Tax=Cypionkella psychrotolerans TaxID=1678131 RepID=UPI0006B4C2D4|nr:MBOAT family protein [Cypionkella psychrotolerans]
MVFSSETFLFLFLPLFLCIYYLTPAKGRSMVILFASYLFYGWWRFDFLLLLFGTTLWTFYIGLLIAKNLDTPRAKMWCGIGVAGCLAVLGVFKYLNFFIDSLAQLFGTDAAGLGVHWRLILPIGVSFYVFHSISYLVDVTRKDADATLKFFDFAAFIALFPQLVAGPILRFKDLADQFKHRTHSLVLFADGLALFIVGLGKKVLLADTIAPLADVAFNTPDPSAALSWLGSVAYMMQLYFDFSGYSDMAVGLGLMMGFRFRKNFDMPYISRSITEFWRRWHISLSVWLRDYLYIPLGGNRVGPTRTYVNLMIVMVLGGLWHGANGTFLAWGIWHGAWLAIERATGWANRSSFIGLVQTLLLVLIGWVAFRAVDMHQAMDVYAGMIGLHGFAIPMDVAFQLSGESMVMLVIAMIYCAAEPHINRIGKEMYFAPQGGIGVSSNGTLTAATSLLPVAVVSLIAMLAIMKLAEASFSPFLYFQF